MGYIPSAINTSRDKLITLHYTSIVHQMLLRNADVYDSYAYLTYNGNSLFENRRHRF